MKKLLSILCVVSLSQTGIITAHAQSRTDNSGNEVWHHMFASAQFQMTDFDNAKISSSYGVGLTITSLSHWGRFHVGADVNFGINAGLAESTGCIIDFGPSARIDICKHVFVNIPVNAMCITNYNEYVPGEEGEEIEDNGESTTNWGMKIMPSIYGFITDRFGVFAGPQVCIPFESRYDTTFGFQAGISYAF